MLLQTAQTDSLKVRVGSWNVATKSLQEKDRHLLDLTHWLSASSTEKHAPSVCPTQSMQDTCDSPDIVVVGFQELLHQGNAALLSGVQYSHWAAIHPHHSVDSSIPTGPPDRRYGSAHIDGLEPWIWMVLDALSKTHGPRVDGDAATPTDQDSHQLAHHPYRVVCAGRHTAIGIAVFVRHHLAITRIGWGSVGTGLAGCYGNKGSAAVSIDVVSTKGKIHSLCFMDCHLGAHEGEGRCIWRNQEMSSILETLVMEDIYICSDMRTTRKDLSSLSDELPDNKGVVHVGPILPRRVRMAGDHDALWLFGDLNYRLMGTKINGGRWGIDAGVVIEKPQRCNVLELVRCRDIARLLQMDEVSFLRHHRHGAMGLLDEQPIHFLPTYKFNMGSHGEWQSLIGHGKEGSSRPLQPPCRLSTDGAPADISSSFSKKRLPAYCDRILHAGRGVSGKGYWSKHEYSFSDHVPVCADYHVMACEESLPKPVFLGYLTNDDANGHGGRSRHRYQLGQDATWSVSLRCRILWRRAQRIERVNRHWAGLVMLAVGIRFLYQMYIGG
ncbi:hypothetical protein BASA61_006302 [Batrachochytrium salamandrivorans]|nr:hypothetical protein BASA61_006302 [Batrachochytrium salamandrivorans]